MSTTGNNNSSNPSQNSVSQMVLQVPKQIKVKLVNCADLDNLKIWSGLTSFFSNASVGLWVWYGQNANTQIENFILVVAILITITTGIFGFLTFRYNEKLKQETSEISYNPE